MRNVREEEQRTYWESRTKRRTPTHPAVRVFARSKIEILHEVLGPRSSEHTMLEVGAGDGYFSHYLDQDFELTALDFSANMLQMNPLASEKKIVGDAQDLDFDDDAFDIVFCANLLHHLPDPQSAVGEMGRVAKRHVVLVEPNALNPLMFLFGVLVPEERGTLQFVPEFVRQLGAHAGLVLEHFCTQGVVLPNKTPEALVGLLSHFERAFPLGFYHLAVFSVEQPRSADVP